MIPDLGCTAFQANIGLAVFALGFGTIPLVTAAVSEEVGRQPVYLTSAAGLTLTHVGMALSKNIQTVIVLRFLQGGFGSSGAIMTGGTIADIWMPEESV
jgi:MFS family permease